jgi:glutamyl-tRNA reductase
MNRVIKRIALDAASSKVASDSEQLEVEDTMREIIDKYLPEVTKDMKETDDFSYLCHKTVDNEIGLDDLLSKFPDEDKDTLYAIV